MKIRLLLDCKGLIFLLYSNHKGVICMSNISDYIKSKPALKRLDFLTVYLTIVELIKSGEIELENNV